mgnify:CR=1 FL=1
MSSTFDSISYRSDLDQLSFTGEQKARMTARLIEAANAVPHWDPHHARDRAEHLSRGHRRSRSRRDPGTPRRPSRSALPHRDGSPAGPPLCSLLQSTPHRRGTRHRRPAHGWRRHRVRHGDARPCGGLPRRGLRRGPRADRAHRPHRPTNRRELHEQRHHHHGRRNHRHAPRLRGGLHHREGRRDGVR